MERVRGVWITNVDSNVLNARQNIVEAMQLIADTGFNYVFPVVWNKGYTLYRSATMQKLFGVEIDPNPAYIDRDPLAEVAEAAHQVGLKVVPWFEYGFATSYERNGGHILQTQPHWAAKDQTGNLLKKNGFEWMNAFDSEVQQFMLDLFLEVVSGYDVEGVQGDDRLPALPSEGGYDDQTKALYRNQFGVNPPTKTKDKTWLQWRADRLTAFLAQLRKAVKAVNSDLILSIAPSPYPFGYTEYLQDIPAWLKQGLVDLLHPQFYRYKVDQYQSLVKDWASRFPNAAAIVSPGILAKFGTYAIDPAMLWQCIQHNRSANIGGEVLFFYESLRVNDRAVAKYLKARHYADYLILRKGQMGPEVEALQQQLKLKGFDPGMVDGKFGKHTEAAVKAFQKLRKLARDGVVGAATWNALFG